MPEEMNEKSVIKWAQEIAEKIIRNAEEYSKKYLSEEYINKIYEKLLAEEEKKLLEEIERVKKVFDERIAKIKSIPQEKLKQIVDKIIDEVMKI